MQGEDIWVEALEKPDLSACLGLLHCRRGTTFLIMDELSLTRLRMTQRTLLQDVPSRPPNQNLRSSHTIMPPGLCWASRKGAEP